MDKATNLRWHLLSIQERVQLVRFTQRLTALQGRCFGTTSPARSGSDRADDDDVAWESALRGKKNQSGQPYRSLTSLAVKNTWNAGVESKGFCHYKCSNGIKRHLAVDTVGLPFFTHCTPASVSDDSGLIELLSQNLNYFRAGPVNISKITILPGSRLSP